MNRLKQFFHLIFTLSCFSTEWAHSQQFVYELNGPTVVAVDAIVEASIRVTFAAPSDSAVVQGAIPNSSLSVNGSPVIVNPQAFYQQGALLYTPTGSEPLNVGIELCRYSFKAGAITVGTLNLTAGMTSPPIHAGSAATAPTLAYNPGAGTVIAYRTNGTGPSIAVVNGVGGSGVDTAATTSVTICVISNGGSAFTVAQFHPAISATGSAAPQPAGIALPACVPLASVTLAQLRCSETQGAGSPVNRTWSLSCPVAYASEVPAPPVLESESVTGGLPDAPSSLPLLSGNRLQQAFVSAATNIVAGDSNGRDDIFLRDRTAGIAVRVSAVAEAMNPGGQASCTDPAISRQGGRIAA